MKIDTRITPKNIAVSIKQVRGGDKEFG